MPGSAVAAAPAASESREVVAAPGLRFTIASRPQSRFANAQQISNTVPMDFQPIGVPAAGYVRKLKLEFTQVATFASAGAIVTGDSPWNLITSISVTDAQGQPITQPVSGYVLYLINKYFSAGHVDQAFPRPYNSPQLSPDYDFTVTGGTTARAHFFLELDFEQDANTGYCAIPNLDANANIQVRISAAAYTSAFTGTTPSAVSLTCRIEQHYWLQNPGDVGGVAAESRPRGVGDYLETRIETQTVSAATENIVNVNAKGGIVRGHLIISRAAGVRTAYTAGAPFGIVLDNVAVDEGVTIDSRLNTVRQAYGLIGADLTTTYAPLTAGILPGLDRGVIPVNYGMLSGGRDSWLPTRPGSLLQFKLTPGASATTLEIVTLIAQVKSAPAFYATSALD